MLARAASRQRRPFLTSPHRTCEQRSLHSCLDAPTIARQGPAASTLPRVPRWLYSRHRIDSTPLSPSKSNTRAIGTTADAYSPSSDAIQALSMQSPLWSQAQKFVPHDFDPLKPLSMPFLPVGPPSLPDRAGISGDPRELHRNLFASLRVGRFDRARAIINRLESLYHQNNPVIGLMHTEYVNAVFTAIQSASAEISYSDLLAWFNSKIFIKRGGPPVQVHATAQMFVTMVRATMVYHTEEGKDQYIIKLLESAWIHELYEDVMSSDEYSQDEWATLFRLQPDFFEQPSNNDLIANDTDDGNTVEETMPEARAPDQKGLGFATLQESLEGMKGIGFDFDDQNIKTLEDLQIAFEERAVAASIRRWKTEHTELVKKGVTNATQGKSMQALVHRWFTAMVAAVDEEKKNVRLSLNRLGPNGGIFDDRPIYGPYLELFTSDTLAAVTIMVLLNAFSYNFVKDGQSGTRTAVTSLAMAISKTLDSELRMQLNAEQMKNLGNRVAAQRKIVVRKLRKDTPAGRVRLSTLDKLKEIAKAARPDAQMVADAVHEEAIPVEIKARLGAILLETLTNVATIDVQTTDSQTGKEIKATHPAFSHTQGWNAGRRLGKIACHHDVSKLLMKQPTKGSVADRLPMIVPPRPWTGLRTGGYLKYPVEVVRLKIRDDLQKAYLRSAIARGDMKNIFHGLDILGKTAWVINKDVLRVLVEMWNTGEEIAGLAPENPNVPLPPKPHPDAPLSERREWVKDLRDAEHKRSGFHSTRCAQNAQLHIARNLVGRAFYTPHNIDYRGRAYPVPGSFNHMGADMARSLFKFSVGKELGTAGLKWLKVHLANLAGHDKASLAEREEFTMQHLPDIYDSANNPIDGNRWWIKAEDPWQLLGACFELRNALEAPDPTRFVSNLTVHQDGTCNGLQHYAALGGDSAGAAQVNLEPGDRPSDIYTAVADIVRESITRAANNGNTYAKLVQDHITRKVVKQTVMTNVYGVTFVGARDQVRKQLDDHIPMDDAVKVRLDDVAGFVAAEIFKALGVMFGGARDLQFWLGECASRISTSVSPEQIDQLEAKALGKQSEDFQKRFRQRKSKKKASLTMTTLTPEKQFKTPVIWTTPLKFPVVQPYRAEAAKKIKTSWQTLTIRDSHASDPVDKKRQLQGFAPNFIHSLDATHMFLAANRCDELGLTFAAVHDSFWTHACDVPVMNTVIRDVFVEMHSEDIVGRLAAEFSARYSSSLYRTALNSQTEVGQQILELRRSERFARQKEKYLSPKCRGNMSEVFLERRRQKLLASEDAAERAEGAEIVTPISIFQAAARTTTVFSSIAEEHQLLGDVDGTQATYVEQKLSDDTATQYAFYKENAYPSSYKKKADDDEIQSETAIDDTSEALSDTKNRPVKVWLPVVFPPVPSKGDFDVAKLKKSLYFFS